MGVYWLFGKRVCGFHQVLKGICDAEIVNKHCFRHYFPWFSPLIDEEMISWTLFSTSRFYCLSSRNSSTTYAAYLLGSSATFPALETDLKAKEDWAAGCVASTWFFTEKWSVPQEGGWFFAQSIKNNGFTLCESQSCEQSGYQNYKNSSKMFL